MKIANAATIGGNPYLDATNGVIAVPALPEAGAATVGKTYLVTATGHLWRGTESSGTYAFIDITPAGGGETEVTVDAAIDAQSQNPVANAAIAAALEGKANLSAGAVPASELPVASRGVPGILGAGAVSDINLYNGLIGFKTDNQRLDYPLATDQGIAQRKGYGSQYSGVIHSENLNKAVVAALSDENHITLTDAQQAVAKAALGVKDVVVDAAIDAQSANPVENSALSAALDGKADLTAGKVPAAQIPDLSAAYAGKSHTHAQSDVTGLADALDGKANASHTHTKSQITDFSHTHSQSEVTGLADALAGKAASGHTHAQSEISGLADALSGKADASHTHAIADVTGLQSALDGKQAAGNYATLTNGKIAASALPDLSATYVAASGANAANGYAKLDAQGKVPTSLLPSYVSDVFEGYLVGGKFRKTDSASGAEIEAKANAIYVDLKTNKTYRWSGTAYVEISSSLALGTTAETAYPGDSGAALAATVAEHATAIAELETATGGKAEASHTHAQSDVTGLSDALAGKANASHTHTKSQITDFSHTHAQSEVTGLQDALDGKAASSHTHAQSEISGLATALAGKAASSHTHTKSQITDFSHTHAQSEVTGLEDALAGKASSSHTHTKSEITDFSHTHAISDVTGLQSALDGKQAALPSGTAGQYLQKTASGLQWATVAASDGIGIITSRAALSELWDNDPSVRGTTRLFAGLCSNLTDPKEIRLGHLYVAVFLPEAITYTFTSHSYPQVLPTGLPPGEWREITDTYFGRERYDNDTNFANGKYYLDEETGIYTHESGDYHYLKIDNGSAFSGTWYLCDASITDAYDHMLHCNGDDHTLFITESPKQYLTEHSIVTGVEFIPIERHDPPWYAYGETTTTTITIKLLWGDVNPPCLCVTDSALSATSTNPVQNAIIQTALTALESRVAALEAGGTTPTTGTLTVTYSGTAPSGAQWSADSGTTWNAFGASLALAAGSYTVSYKAVSGYVTPTSQSATVTAGSTTSIAANSYTQYGAILVNYSGTAPSGAQWSHDGGTTWTNFGSSVSVAPGSYTISYKTVSGYTSPASASATVTSGSTTTIAADTYTETASTFGLIVRYRNAQTAPSGAAWSYDGSTWNSFPGSVNLAPGSYTLTFKAISGYVTPSAISFTAAANDSIVYDDIYYAAESASYPNAFAVTGADTSSSTSTAAKAAVNGTYVKQSQTTTYGGSTYPVYYNGYYYLYISGYDGECVINTDVYPIPGASGQLHRIASLTSASLSGAWSGASYTPGVTLTFVDSTATTPEYGTLVYDPVDTTKPFLSVANSSTTTYNGNYYLYQGTAGATGSAGSIWKHETASYFISYYSSPSSGSGWYLYNTLAKAQAPNADYGYYTAQIGTGTSNATTDFNGGRTYDGYTVTYDANSGSSGGTPYVEVVNNSDSTYAGNYYLYSGSADATGAIFKHSTNEYYLAHEGPSGSWGISSDGTSAGLAQVTDYDTNGIASVAFASGYGPFNNYTLYYHAS